MTRPVIIGEVLFDVLPTERVLGGAPFNVAWHLHAFGYDPLFISRVGKDKDGGEVRARMAEWGMDPAGLQTDAERPTGRVRVQLEGGEPSYEILADQAYDRIQLADVPAVEASVLYHGTLALRSPVSASTVVALRARLSAPVFVDLNLRDGWWALGRARMLAAGADTLKVNEAELAHVARGGTLDRRAADLMETAGLARLVVTRGAAGAVALEAGALYEVRPEGTPEVVDTVGAGDAFAAVLIAGQLEGWPLAQTLRRAQAFATQVVGTAGATSLPREAYPDLAEVA